jgi:hypothetical protein
MSSTFTQIRPIRLSTIDSNRASQYVNPSVNTEFVINKNKVSKKPKLARKKEEYIPQEVSEPEKNVPEPMESRVHILNEEPVQEVVIEPKKPVEAKEVTFKNFNTYQKLILATLRKRK